MSRKQFPYSTYKMAELTIVGHAAYDYIFNVEEHPRKDESVYIRNWKRYYGGGGANIAMAFSSLGGKSILYTAAGRDFGRYENRLKKMGVKTVLKRSKKKTASAFIFNNASSQKTYFFWGASEEMEKMRGIKSKNLHIAPCHPLLAMKMAEKADFFAFEPGQDLKKYSTENLAKMVEKANIIFCNEREYAYMKKMANLEGKNIIVTLGEKGSIIHEKEGRRINVKAVKPLRFVDATGAGDAYKAAFWFAFLNENEIEKCCRFASVFASFVVEKEGAQNFPSYAKVTKRYERNFGKMDIRRR